MDEADRHGQGRHRATGSEAHGFPAHPRLGPVLATALGFPPHPWLVLPFNCVALGPVGVLP